MYQYTRPHADLYHHGILGMKWGQRNGPPYPLSAEKHSASERQAGWKKSLGGGRNEKLYETDFPSRPDKSKNKNSSTVKVKRANTNESKTTNVKVKRTDQLTNAEKKKYIKKNGEYTIAGREYFLKKAKKDYKEGKLTKEQYKRQKSDIKRNVSNGQIVGRLALNYLKDAGVALAIGAAGTGITLVAAKKMQKDPQLLLKLGNSSTLNALNNLRNVTMKVASSAPGQVVSKAVALAPIAGAGYEFYNKYRKRDEEDKKKLKN